MSCYLLYLIIQLKARIYNKWQIMITFFSMSVTYLIWRNLDNYCLIIGLNSSALVKFQCYLSS